MKSHSLITKYGENYDKDHEDGFADCNDDKNLRPKCSIYREFPFKKVIANNIKPTIDTRINVIADGSHFLMSNCEKSRN